VSYATLMGYRTGDTKSPKKELTALKYALPKETRLVLKNNIIWETHENKEEPVLALKKMGVCYSGTKNIINELVEFNRMQRTDFENISQWETKCRKQGNRFEYCETCTPELIRDRFIVGFHDDTLLSK